ncbi:hypothetical protein [Aquimarina brevivitae]|uniref:Uncharacterized protein n=1 Tax=Aquimarina brevivitae TaxID=323412 RepID=A0A4Q7PF70_9FLAO|nr:hypothetical protein [Aquimarina brevivitae]RZS98807.1 hypothetical protein EV197_0007 [Aquimarina brevivitae]
MLKGKKGLYILLPLVLLIWGAIIYQVVDAFADEDPILTNAAIVNVKDIKVNERKAFTLSTVDRDPFLGTVYKPKKVTPSPTRRPKATSISWPSIQYKGVVSNGDATQAIFLVSINGTDQLMQLGETMADITLVNGDQQKIKTRYKGKIKEFTILSN